MKKVLFVIAFIGISSFTALEASNLYFPKAETVVSVEEDGCVTTTTTTTTTTISNGNVSTTTTTTTTTTCD